MKMRSQTISHSKPHLKDFFHILLGLRIQLLKFLLKEYKIINSFKFQKADPKNLKTADMIIYGGSQCLKAIINGATSLQVQRHTIITYTFKTGA